jgi:hypothetical protein
LALVIEVEARDALELEYKEGGRSARGVVTGVEAEKGSSSR